ncbi:ATPase [Deinococcus sp.]|uniref:ATPase n=1 Tax=Deinococcus sp. TaxID=47478 RepID=UPI003B5BE218
MTLSPLADVGLFLPSDPRPPAAQPLTELPMIVLVGVTGVGKSTALLALRGETLRVLPDRRVITDEVIVWPLAGRSVTDRQQRFALTARYRAGHPGGMAQALGGLWTVPEPGEQLVFDGLRGLDEVRYAAEHCPQWRFVNLHAPDALRVQRLLGRNDRFDRVNTSEIAGPDSNLRTELTQLGGAAQVFTPAELDELAGLHVQGHTASDILTKTRIVISERQNYDPAAARALLLTLPPWRVLDIDTAQTAPPEVTARVSSWLDGV